MADKPKPKFQGRCIVEEQVSGEFLVMTPDGDVWLVADRDAAEAKCKTWFRRHNRTGFGVGVIEWRKADG